MYIDQAVQEVRALHFACSLLSAIYFLKRFACSSYISSASWDTMAITPGYIGYCSKHVVFVLLVVVM